VCLDVFGTFLGYFYTIIKREEFDTCEYRKRIPF